VADSIVEGGVMAELKVGKTSRGNQSAKRRDHQRRPSLISGGFIAEYSVRRANSARETEGPGR
jgi:hypothetical protein